MRVLITSWAWPSHYLPLAPLGWALRAAGHEVRVASQPRLTPVILDSGAVAVHSGPDLDHDQVRAQSMRDLPLVAVPHAPAAGATMRDWAADPRDMVRRVFRVFVRYAETMVDELLDYAQAWRPDLVVYEPTSYAGPLVAAALGVPAVRHVQGVDVTYQAAELLPELLAPVCRRLGLSDVDPLGTVTVDPCPPSIQIQAGLKRIPVRYIPYNGPAVLPEWLYEPAGKPRLVVTWGTSTTRLTGSGTFRPPEIISATRGLDCELVIALTGADAAELGEVPNGVRVVESLALHLLLPGCAAVVHQGGNGTILTGVHCGVPQLLLPQLPDQTFLADQFANSGAGIVVRPDQATPEGLREALGALLREAAYRQAAARLRDEALAQPTPAQIVPVLQALAQHRAS
ncbi:MAG: DUF1205 domain-containing protein [Micromonosporaceae bacterium]|nr:DUF1205 domain-containing protein [Micromonosporaceae bacterium]